MPKVDVGIACSSVQYPKWWTILVTNLLQEQQKGIEITHFFAVTSALPDFSKNNTILDRPEYESKRRVSLTDMNRVNIVNSFLDGDSDWLWFIDDDTVPPEGSLSHLLSLGRDFVGGLYFNPSPPNNPIAYIRRPEDGLYHAYYGYERGTLTQVDSIGMGCTLIHRSVFEKILDAHKLFERPNGSLIAIHKDNIYENNDAYAFDIQVNEYVENGWLHTRMSDLAGEPEDDDTRPFPFYALEYCRTEDHHFCELCANVGIKPWLDTKLVCGHLKPKEVAEAEYLMEYYKVREKLRQ